MTSSSSTHPESPIATVSVVINSYNYGRFVVEAIDSALAQSVPPAEVIVVDDGSTDDTARILEDRFAGHSAVKVLRQRNGGQLSALVLGLEHASGDLICFLDADDKYEPNHLLNVTGVFAEHEDVDFVFTAHRCFGQADDVVQYAPEDLSLGFSVIATLKERIFLGSITSTLAIRRSLSLTLLPVLRQVAPRWRVRADDAIVFGGSLAGAKKHYLAEPTVLYRIHDKNDHIFCQVPSIQRRFAHGLRRDTLLELLSRHLGLGPSVRLRVVWEFLSIQQPTRSQYRVYVRLNWQIQDSLLKGLKGRIKIYLHYKRHRPAWDISTPVEFHA
ncbi:MAG: glycosyltransferase family 2 protein [Terracidiphilus sp.]